MALGVHTFSASWKHDIASLMFAALSPLRRLLYALPMLVCVIAQFSGVAFGVHIFRARL